MRVLDLFCGAGGAARGYMDAGFEVTGYELEQIAPRILDRVGRPFRVGSLVRHLQRHGRHDLVPAGAQRREVAR